MRHGFLFTTAFIAASTLFAGHARADDQSDEIVVTATRAPAQASRLPAEVDVIDIGEAQARGDATLAEALRAAPGMDVVSAGGLGQQTSLFAGGANSNDTLVLFDGLRINDPSTPGSSFDAGQDLLGDLSRVEVVQGPMSAVFGSDAIGGVVNLIPRHGGPGPLNGRLDVSGGSFNTLRGAAGVDGAIGRFRYAVTGEGFATIGYDLVPKRMSTHTGEGDGSSMSMITGVFDADVSSSFSLDLLLRTRQAQADFDPFPFDFLTFNSFRAEDDNLKISRNDLSLGRLGATWRTNDRLSLRATYGGMRQQRVQSDDARDGFLLDGFPRTIGQAEALGIELGKLGRRLTAVLLIEVPDEEIVRRLSGRRVSKSGRVYHIEFDPPKHEGRCDIDGTPLIQRDDDKPETVKKRLEVYHELTSPLVAFYEDRGLLRRFDGTRAPTEVHDHIRATIATLRLEDEL